MDLNTQKKVADNLKLLRNVYGYTQAEVADELHICRSTYTLYELGKKFPSTDLLLDLASLYDIWLDTFFDTRTDIYLQRVFSQERSKKEVSHLVDTYLKLSPHSQGKLIERADILLETDGFLATG